MTLREQIEGAIDKIFDAQPISIRIGVNVLTLPNECGEITGYEIDGREDIKNALIDSIMELVEADRKQRECDNKPDANQAVSVTPPSICHHEWVEQISPDRPNYFICKHCGKPKPTLPDVPEGYVHIGLINDKGKVKLIIDGEEEFGLNEGESLSRWVRTKKVVEEKL